MIQIISSTDRPNSRSHTVSKIVQSLYQDAGTETEVMNLEDLAYSDLCGGVYGQEHSAAIQTSIKKIEAAQGLIMVVPEYNGSLPGALKLFMDHWTFPDCYEFRPVAFIGLGGRFGGLRPVEHLQQIFGYRNAFLYPERVFLINVWELLKDDTVQCEETFSLMKAQTAGFLKFLTALESQKMTPTSK